jgi:hypothetical protein
MLNCSFVGGRVKNVYAITTLIHIQFLAEHVKCAYSCHNEGVRLILIMII